MNTTKPCRGRLIAAALLSCLGLAQAAEDGARRPSWEEERDRNELADRQRHFSHRPHRGNDADYARSLMAAAARERDAVPNLLPGAKAGDFSLGEVWTSLGPARMNAGPMDSGRVSAIATHPTNSGIVYVASAGGGLWRSQDAGLTWKALTDTLGTLGTGALALDPSQPNRLYLGLGDTHRTGLIDDAAGTSPGLGVVRSSDGGNSWSAPVLLGDSSNIRKILVSPNNGNLVLAATDRGLYRSTDAGASYQLQTLDEEDGKAQVWSIAWSGGNRFAVTTRGKAGGRIWFSGEQAAGWTVAAGYDPDIGRATVASAPSSPNVQYAVTHRNNTTLIYKSVDGGQHWTALNTAQNYANLAEPISKLLGTQPGYNQMVVVNPTNPGIVYFGGQLRLVRSGDGGTSFHVVNAVQTSAANYVHPDFHAAAYDAARQLYVGSDGGVYRSGNAGTSWTPLNDGLVTHLVYGVSSSLDDPGDIWVALQDNGIFHSSNTGADYSRAGGGDGFWALQSQADARKLILATNGGTYWSDDGGHDGDPLAYNGIPNGNALTVDQSPAVASGETLYAVSAGKIYRSTDFGKQWQAFAANGLPGKVRWVRAGRNAGVVAAIVGSAPGQIWFTLDNGAHWTQAAAPLNVDSDGDFFDLAIDGANRFYVISDGFRDGKSRIWSSTNPAAGWLIGGWSGLPAGMRVNIVRADPARPGTVYLGTDLGMYRSTNQGQTFSRLGAALPLVSIAHIWIARDGSRLRVGTYGRGVWNLELAD